MTIKKLLPVLVCTAAVFCAAGAVRASKPDLESVEMVALIQEGLNAAGYDCGTADGIAGENTKAAIRSYREANALPEGDQIDAGLFNALTLTGEEQALVHKAEEICADVLEEGNETGEITLYEGDLYITVLPDYTAQELLPVQETAQAVTKAIAAEEDLSPLWETVTFSFGVLGEIENRKEDYQNITGVKEALDEYEAFIAGYCTFMQDFDGKNPAALSSYFSLVQEYDAYEEKIGAMKEAMMSEEDRRYFDEVLERVQEQLAGVEQQ